MAENQLAELDVRVKTFSGAPYPAVTHSALQRRLLSSLARKAGSGRRQSIRSDLAVQRRTTTDRHLLIARMDRSLRRKPSIMGSRWPRLSCGRTMRSTG